ncbi:MAG: hypothetical protein R6X06_04815 [Gammaproteobacteria bacterium]
MSIVLVLTVSSLLFALGYYLGNQYGRTAHVRDDLRRARSPQS